MCSSKLYIFKNFFLIIFGGGGGGGGGVYLKIFTLDKKQCKIYSLNHFFC